jgi:hypothetical protein
MTRVQAQAIALTWKGQTQFDHVVVERVVLSRSDQGYQVLGRTPGQADEVLSARG